ncbi:MAG: hypothetical protein ACP5D0_09545 [Hydrogenovibrio sp.]
MNRFFPKTFNREQSLLSAIFSVLLLGLLIFFAIFFAFETGNLNRIESLQR